MIAATRSLIVAVNEDLDLTILTRTQERDVDVLATKRKGEDVVEGLGAVVVLAHEPFEAALKLLDGGARCDVAKEVAPDDAISREPREARLVTVVLLDVSVVIDGDQTEWQSVDFLFGELEEVFGVEHASDSA